MENAIQDYVGGLFTGAPDTQQAYELKIELIQNLTDKYNDLLAEGKSPEDAYNITILGIGDVGELLKEIDSQQNIGFFERNYGSVLSSGDKNRRALVTTVAVMLYILSVIPVMVLDSLAGVVMMLVMVAMATGLLVYASMTRQRGAGANETVVGEFRQWQADKDRMKGIEKALKAAFWPMVLVLYFMLSFSTGRWEITWLIFPIAPAAYGIIKAVLEFNRK